jgi:hypothetical protein
MKVHTLKKKYVSVSFFLVFSITKEHLIAIATAIVGVFPSDTTVAYYLPDKSGQAPTDKIFDRHCKAKLSVADLSEPKEIIKPTVSNLVPICGVDDHSNLAEALSMIGMTIVAYCKRGNTSEQHLKKQ